MVSVLQTLLQLYLIAFGGDIRVNFILQVSVFYFSEINLFSVKNKSKSLTIVLITLSFIQRVKIILLILIAQKVKATFNLVNYFNVL